jgi:ABC-2 type transport system permease protein
MQEILLLRFAFLWIGIYIGLVVKIPGGARRGVGAAISGNDADQRVRRSRVDARLARHHRGVEPDFVNGVGHRASYSATREPPPEGLGPRRGQYMMALVWPLLILVVTLPLAVRRYQNLGR